MAILQSMDGRFYRIPEEEVEKFLVPADKVEETLRAVSATQPQAAAPAPAQGPMPAPGPAPMGRPMNCGAPSVVIIVGGGAPQQPFGGGSGPQQPMAAPAAPGQVQAYNWSHQHHHSQHWGGG